MLWLSILYLLIGQYNASLTCIGHFRKQVSPILSRNKYLAKTLFSPNFSETWRNLLAKMTGTRAVNDKLSQNSESRIIPSVEISKRKFGVWWGQGRSPSHCRVRLFFFESRAQPRKAVPPIWGVKYVQKVIWAVTWHANIIIIPRRLTPPPPR